MPSPALAAAPLRLLRTLAQAGDWVTVPARSRPHLDALVRAGVPVERDGNRARLRQCDAVAWLLGTPRRIPGKAFGKRLYAARRASGMSLRELGALVQPGASGAAASLNAYERDRHEPRIGTAHQIGSALGVPVCEMLGDGCRR